MFAVLRSIAAIALMKTASFASGFHALKARRPSTLKISLASRAVFSVLSALVRDSV